MGKAKPTPAAKMDLITELRSEIKVRDAELEKLRDRLGDAHSQVRHLEKTNSALTEENAALHRSLRSAECDKAWAEGRAIALEAFTPEVLVPRNRFAAPTENHPVNFDRMASPSRHWFERRS